MRADVKGISLVAAGSVLFGTIGYWVTYLGHVPLPWVLLARFGGAALAFAVAALHPGLRALVVPARAAWPRLALMGALLAAVDAALFAAIPRVGVGVATVLLYSAPVFVALGSWLALRERPTGRVLAGVAVGLAGVALVAAPGPATAAASPAGAALGVLAAVAWAGWLLASRAAGRAGVPGEAQAAASCLVAAALVAPVAVLFPVAWAPGDAPLALGLALVAGALPLLLVARGLRTVSAPAAAVVGYLEPATALLVGALAFGERVGAPQAAGVALVLLGASLASAK